MERGAGHRSEEWKRRGRRGAGVGYPAHGAGGMASPVGCRTYPACNGLASTSRIGFELLVFVPVQYTYTCASTTHPNETSSP